MNGQDDGWEELEERAKEVVKQVNEESTHTDNAGWRRAQSRAEHRESWKRAKRLERRLGRLYRNKMALPKASNRWSWRKKKRNA